MMRYLLDILFPPRDDERILRAVSCDDFLVRVAPQVVSATHPATTSLLSFADPVVRAAIHEAKYHGNDHAFELLAQALTDYLNDLDVPTQDVLLVPIPLGKTRLRARGFNQTERILARTSQHFRTDAALLHRTRETASQVTLPRHEREENMRDAFATQHPADPQAAYIIIDDVVTTGATLQAAIDALTAAGATHIIPVALAH